MEGKLQAAGKDVLVDIVKLAQKKGMEGSKGGWKQFLSSYDKKNGASLSDPSRRTLEVLLAFLNTFTEEEDLKYFEEIMESYVNRDNVLKDLKKSASAESPEQKLVRLTLEHPQYPSSYLFPSHEEGWEVTKKIKKSKAMKSNDMISVDCEMVLCEDGTEALVRVCVVDRNLEVKLDKLVKPDKAVANYRTDITGITAEDLENETCSLLYVQKSLKNLLRNGTILVGHSLNNDLRALKLDHARVIDTALVFKYANGSHSRRPSLTDLCKSVLGFELRETGAPHNCLDDACAAMKLVLAKIESGVENHTLLPEKDVPEKEMTKLLVHRITTSLPEEELHNIIAGDFTIEVKTAKKAGGGFYSAFVIFRNQQLANEAYKNLDGKEEQDSSGRPRKLVSYKLTTGVTDSLYVCKMVHDSQIGQSVSKRSLEGELPVKSSKRSLEGEVPVKSKKSKPDSVIQEPEQKQGDSEIERLKLQLSLRDQEISKLNKIIVALTRKQKR
ncbi:small RNA degrading nuclease 1-like isoform X2 [Apium graveolens]|uniref:small RNA degrading nuclease 1-like isoform X2 n=1 Tax=Apium graveolens TaxID=4045 RepID=UPI003D7AF75A